jgi:hypothetical protein
VGHGGELACDSKDSSAQHVCDAMKTPCPVPVQEDQWRKTWEMVVDDTLGRLTGHTKASNLTFFGASNYGHLDARQVTLLWTLVGFLPAEERTATAEWVRNAVVADLCGPNTAAVVLHRGVVLQQSDHVARTVLKL